MNKLYFLFAFTLPSILFAQQTPLSIEPASLIEPGYAQTNLGISFLHNQSFPLSGLTGNLYKLGNIRFSISLSEYVELQTEGTLLDLLYVQSRRPAFNSSIASTKNPTGDIGDFSLWTKFLILREYRSGVALSVKFGAQLPNASNESGLGIDEMNFYSSFLIEKHLGGLLIANVGLGILSDPTKVGSQHDVCMYGMRYVLPIGSSTFAIVQYAGRAGHSGVGVNGLRSWKTGIEESFGDIAVRVSAIKNNSVDDKAFGGECMMMYSFHAMEIP